MGNPRSANGHRRRELRRRHLASAASRTCAWEHCRWPDEPFDPSLHHHDDRAPEVDEIIPVSLGGDPLSWSNTRLLHRWCNQQRGNGTRTPRQPPPQPTPSKTW